VTLLVNSNTGIESQKLVEALKESLLNGVSVKIKLGGNSMWPFIKQDTEATIKKTEFKDLKIGDIIVFSSSKKLIAHRIIKLKKGINEIVTKGDNEFFCDKKIGLVFFHGKIIMLKTKTKTINLDSNFYRNFNFFLAKMTYVFTPFYRLIFKISIK